jgi:hypothetical protein
MGQNPNSIPSDNHFLLNHSPSPHSAPGDWRFLPEEELGKTFWNRRGLSLLRTDLVRYARPPWSGSRSRCELARRSCPGPRNDGPIYALMAYPTSLGSAGLSGAPRRIVCIALRPRRIKRDKVRIVERGALLKAPHQVWIGEKG